MNALVPIANGSDEIESTAIIDTLRRVGVEVVVAAVGGQLQVTMSRGLGVVGDKLIEDCTGPFDAVVLPGGMPGADNLAACRPLGELLRQQNSAGRLIAAICASPAVVLKPAGILDGRKATCYPAFMEQLEPSLALVERVVKDGHVLTSRGPGTAIEFAVAVARELVGDAMADEVAEALLLGC